MLSGNKEVIVLRTSILLFLFFLALNVFQSATADPAMGPKSYLPENIFEFEPVLEGTEVVHDFILFNQGDSPLHILDVKAG